MNALGSGLEFQDLQMALSHSQTLSTLVIPKVQSEKDIHFIAKFVDAFPGLSSERYTLSPFFLKK